MSTKLPALPELPPGYSISYSRDNDDPVYHGWDIYIRGNYFDGGDPEEPPPKTRVAAVNACWALWLSMDCDPAWRRFIRAARKAAK